MKTRLMIITTLVLASALWPIAAGAQSVTANNEVYEGKSVRQVLFDREHITVVLSDGTTVDGVTQLNTFIDKTAGVNTPKSDTPKAGKADAVYDLKGRKTSTKAKGRQHGVYIKRSGGKTKKVMGKK